MSDYFFRLRPLAAFALLAWAVTGGHGCSATGPGTTISGGNPAAPPGPPAEIPTALQIPKDLSLNFEKVQAEAPAASESPAALTSKSAVAPEGEFSDEVEGTTETAQFFADALSGLLDPYNQFLIPVGTNITTFQGVSVVQVSGKVELVEIKIDFADFDFDRDGKTEGCSGHTARLPICMAIYADGVPQIAGVFTAFPTQINPGAGRLMGLNLTHAVFLFPKGDFIGINYNFSNPAEGKTVEFLVRGNPDNPLSEKGLRFRMSMDQQGPEETSLKTVNIHFEMDDGEAQTLQAVARWREDQDLWSGTFNREPDDPDLSDLTEQCVNLLTGDGVAQSECVDLGIDVGGIPFVEVPDETTLFMPDVF